MAIQTWTFDPAHSSVNFVARHMVVARVYGRFDRFAGSLEMDPNDLTTGNVAVEIDASSVDSNNVDRDNHVRGQDFLDVAKYPQVTFLSTRVEAADRSSCRVTGNLTLHGVTKPIVLEAKHLGMFFDPWGFKRVFFNARGSVSRTEFGIAWAKTLDNGGWLVSDKIDLELDVQATMKK